MKKIVVLCLEFGLLFIAMPLAVYYRLAPNAPIPFLLVLAFFAWLYLRRDPTFNRVHFVGARDARQQIEPVVVRSALACSFLGMAVWRFAPELLFSMVRRAPLLWAMAMLLYPLLSVYPQELIFRAYFFQRYRPLFGVGWPMITASALAFGFVHIIFGNWIAVVLSLAGGFLFAITYHDSGSMLLACLEHAFYGNFIFTIGLGEFFYHGTARLG